MKNSSAVMRISYRLTANFVFLIHLILVCILVVGWLLPGLFYLHLTLLLATFLSEIFLGYYLLTHLEFGIRKKLDPTLLFDKSCIVHYIRKWRGLTPRPVATTSPSFLKKNGFIFILLALGILSFSFRYFINL